MTNEQIAKALKNAAPQGAEALDAKRYRWLRSEEASTDPRFYYFWNEFNVKLCREGKMDALIDAAMDRTTDKA